MSLINTKIELEVDYTKILPSIENKKNSSTLAPQNVALAKKFSIFTQR